MIQIPSTQDSVLNHQVLSHVMLATQELADLRQDLEHARSELAQLQTAIALAAPLAAVPSLPQLQDANEQLLLSALRVQKEAERAAMSAAHALRFSSTIDGWDSLTRLPNRALLLDRLAQAIISAGRGDHRVALLHVDLQGFGRINRSFGHAAGDKLLQLIARRLASSVRASDTVSRQDGDEFLVLMTDVAQRQAARTLAESLGKALTLPHQIEGRWMVQEASIGIALYPDDGPDAGALLDRAQAAMRHARHHSLPSFMFPPDHSERAALPDEGERGAQGHVAWQDDKSPRTQQAWRAPLREANEQLTLAALRAQSLQAAAEAARTRQTEVLTMVAHEMRNPLAPLRIAATLLLKGRPEDARLRQLQTIIDRQVSYLSRLVGDLLDVSRSRTGKLRIEREAVAMDALIEEAASCCRPAMAARSQRLVMSVPTVPLLVEGDPLRLMQVLCNLLDNASKYTPIGGSITLSVIASVASMTLTVSDDGIGITPESLPKVFEPFVQDPHAIGFNGAGLGVGLTVVRELVEAHGGRVVANSAGKGCGSQFTVSLPLMHDKARRPT